MSAHGRSFCKHFTYSSSGSTHKSPPQEGLHVELCRWIAGGLPGPSATSSEWGLHISCRLNWDLHVKFRLWIVAGLPTPMAVPAACVLQRCRCPQGVCMSYSTGGLPGGLPALMAAPSMCVSNASALEER